MKKKIKEASNKIEKRDKRLRLLKIILLIVSIFLILLYIILKLIYEVGNFTITLDTSYGLQRNLFMYESLENKICLDTLTADNIEFMTNISGDWIPQNINDEADGGHNGQNYIAYTFYLENMGKEVINYWYRINITDTIREADEAVRLKIIKNGEEKVYAKANKNTGEAEIDTIKFFSDDTVALEEAKDFRPGDIDKYTVVIWIEGDDPDCIDSIIGGETKLSMVFTEEHIQQEGDNTEEPPQSEYY